MIQKNKIRKIILSISIFIILSVFLIKIKKDISQISFFSKNINKNENIGISLDSVKHVFIRNGIKHWTLEAKRIDIDQNRIEGILDHPNIEIFIENGDTFYLSAKSGVFDLKSNRVSVFGDVLGGNKKYTIKTDKMNYNPKNFLITSKDSVILFEDVICMKTNSVVINLDTKLLNFSNNIK